MFEGVTGQGTGHIIPPDQQPTNKKVDTGSGSKKEDPIQDDARIRPSDETKFDTGSLATREENASEKNPNELTPEEKEQVKKLQQRDAEVRAHEAAHQAAAGNLANGGASYDYQRGPDGKNYAVGGHVSINTGKGRTPEETIQRAQQIQAAALAPADPSGQDMKVAAKAAQMANEAQADLQQKRSEEANPDETEKTSEAHQHHSQTPEHIRSCPECLQKTFSSKQGHGSDQQTAFA